MLGLSKKGYVEQWWYLQCVVLNEGRHDVFDKSGKAFCVIL